MRYSCLTLSALALIAGLLLLTSCQPAEPTQIGSFTLTTVDQEIPQAKSQPICRALEDAGYIMPYGPIFGEPGFKITESYWVLDESGTNLFVMPRGQPEATLTVDWDIPADLNWLPDRAVSQQTIESLAGEANKICRIVQQEAATQGLGSVKVSIGLWDLVVGLELDYSSPNGQSTNDCNQLTGAFVGKSVGLNPSGRTPDHCPSLYVAS